MKTSPFLATLLLGAFAVGAGCSSGTSTADPAGDGGPGGSSGSVPEIPGACGGLVSCGGECTTLDEDAKNCGACGSACPAGQVCERAQCRPGTCEAYDGGTHLYVKPCGSLCVDVRRNPDHCGGCGTRCGARQTCYESVCVDVFGAGASCADPIVMPGGGGNVEVAFTFDGATETQALTCGDPTARPRKVFRFTANDTKPNASFEIKGGLPTDDLVLEVFRDASCDAASAIGCNDDDRDKRPRLKLAIETGRTYFVVVSSKGPPPAGRFYMKFDD
ncbi:MAG: hypothetical protein KF819_13070 [Labilithrix sp.]|nr:hypothetical protein [Labilithrix sp.]